MSIFIARLSVFLKKYIIIDLKSFLSFYILFMQLYINRKCVLLYFLPYTFMTRADLNPSSDPQSSLCASQLVSHLATIFWLFIPYTHSFPAKWPPATWLKLFNSGRLTHRQNAVGEHRLKLGEPAGKHTRTSTHTQRIFSLRLWLN